MFKSTFLALMALILCLSAQAGSFIRTHDDFVHLSDYEKNQLIIKTMELVVALESQYNYEVKKYGYNSDRFEKFIKAVSKVKSILFIDSAYAAPSSKRPMTDWNSYGNAFKQLMSKSGSNCFFAGWPSKPYVLNGKTYCGHPDFIQGDSPTRHKDKPMADWTLYYPDPKAGSGCGANDRKKIQCNPAIFGFKNAANKDLFCVTASDGAHNSAYNCMQEALKERPANSSIDSPTKRLGDLRTSLEGNSDAFKAIQEFAYKTCVCENTTPKNFNSNYQAYVQKHRTCYGMMEMMAAVTCGATTPLMDTSIFTSLRNYTKDKIIYNAESAASNTRETMVDYHYEKFIKEEVQKSAKDEYNFLCKGIARPEVIVEPTKTYKCTNATCKESINGETKSYSCSAFAIKIEGTEESAQLDVAPAEVPTTGDQTELVFTGKIAGKDVPLSCPVVFENDPAKMTYTCNEAKCKTIPAATPEGKSTFECSYSVVDKDGKAATFATAPTEKPAEGSLPAEGAELSITGKIGDQDVPLKCPLTITPAETVTVDNEPKSYECSKAECSAVSAVASTALPGLQTDEPTEKPAAFTCALTASLDGKEEKVGSASPEGTPADGSSSKFKVKIGDKDVELSCPVTLKKAAVTPKIEPKPVPTGGFVGTPQNQGPPRTQIRGPSDTSAVGIK